MAKRNFSMPAADNKNSVVNLFDKLRLNDKMTCSSADFLKHFLISEDQEISYWRTEFKPHPFHTKDLIKIQGSLFEKGWIHTNFFYQSRGRLSSETVESLTPEFIDNMYLNSCLLAYDVPAAEHIVNSTQLMPPDEAFVYLFSCTSEKVAISAKQKLFSGENYKLISDPKQSDEHPFVVFKDCDTNRPIIFMFMYPKAFIKRIFKDSIGIVEDFDKSSFDNYKMTNTEKLEVINEMFSHFKKLSLQSGLFKEYEPKKIEKIDNNFDFCLLYKRLMGKINDHCSKLILLNIERYKEVLIKADNFVTETNHNFSIGEIQRIYNFNFMNAYYASRPAMSNFVGGSLFDIPIVLSGETKNGIGYHLKEHSYLNYKDSIISDFLDVIKSFDGEYNESDLGVLSSIFKDNDLTDVSSSRFHHSCNAININYLRFTNNIDRAVTKIVSSGDSIIKSDLRIKENFNIFCSLITDHLIENSALHRARRFISNTRAHDRIFEFVKYYIKRISFSTRKVDGSPDVFIKIPNLIPMRSFFFKDTNDHYHYPKIINELIVEDFGCLSNYFSINEQTGELCLLSFGVQNYNGISILEISQNVSICSQRIPDRDKKILIYSIAKNEEDKYPFVVSTFDTPDFLNESGLPKAISKFEDLSEALLGDNSGIDIYFEFSRLLFDLDSSYRIYCHNTNPDKTSSSMWDFIYNDAEMFFNIISCTFINRTFHRHLSRKTSTNFIKFIDDEIDPSYLNLKFNKISQIVNKRDSLSMIVTSKPIVVPCNDQLYSLGLISYHMNSGEVYSDRISIKGYGSHSRQLSLEVDGERRVFDVQGGCTYPNLSFSPSMANKFSASMTSYCPTASRGEKAGHPHFSTRTFICNNGQGNRSFCSWIYEQIKNEEITNNDIFCYYPEFGTACIAVRKSHFAGWIDSIILDMDNLTKSNYNRKTRSHNGLNIEEWTHCRIE